MFALVRFVDDQDNRRHVVSVKDIQDFHPVGKSDYDNKTVYTVFWRDDLEDNTGFYSAQILMLGDTQEELLERKKRPPVPKVTVEESSEDESAIQKRKQPGKLRVLFSKFFTCFFADRAYNGEEDCYGMKLFEKTLRFIINHNERYRKGEASDKVEVNHFADWRLKHFLEMP
ncbi:hypothetical protein V5799_033606 [Amblyomma americanum]|uniref:Cathepsin propeptide inhibitor domain-containing protein n=1 Tax=Amblyomma americanum TaxID=6943 RepID=A0AAQ4DMU3_AMBAM